LFLEDKKATLDLYEHINLLERLLNTMKACSEKSDSQGRLWSETCCCYYCYCYFFFNFDFI